MFEVIQEIIGTVPANVPAEEAATIYSVCAVSIPLLSVVFIDMIRDIFSGFFRG